MNRRNFILLSSLTLPTLVLPSLQGCSRESSFDPSLGHPEMLGQFIDEATLLRIGKRYIALTNESDQTNLVKLILDSASEVKAETLELKLGKAIRKDFRSDRTIIIDGWILAITEARQCALYSLTYQN